MDGRCLSRVAVTVTLQPQLTTVHHDDLLLVVRPSRRSHPPYASALAAATYHSGPFLPRILYGPTTAETAEPHNNDSLQAAAHDPTRSPAFTMILDDSSQDLSRSLAPFRSKNFVIPPSDGDELLSSSPILPRFKAPHLYALASRRSPKILGARSRTARFLSHVNSQCHDFRIKHNVISMDSSPQCTLSTAPSFARTWLWRILYTGRLVCVKLSSVPVRCSDSVIVHTSSQCLILFSSAEGGLSTTIYTTPRGLYASVQIAVLATIFLYCISTSGPDLYIVLAGAESPALMLGFRGNDFGGLSCIQFMAYDTYPITLPLSSSQLYRATRFIKLCGDMLKLTWMTFQLILTPYLTLIRALIRSSLAGSGKDPPLVTIEREYNP